MYGTEQNLRCCARSNLGAGYENKEKPQTQGVPHVDELHQICHLKAPKHKRENATELSNDRSRFTEEFSNVRFWSKLHCEPCANLRSSKALVSNVK